MLGVLIAAGVLLVGCVAAGIIADRLDAAAEDRRQRARDRARHHALMRELDRHDTGPRWRR